MYVADFLFLKNQLKAQPHSLFGNPSWPIRAFTTVLQCSGGEAHVSMAYHENDVLIVLLATTNEANLDTTVGSHPALRDNQILADLHSVLVQIKINFPQ